MHYPSILYLLGWIGSAFAGFMLLPAAMAYGFGDVLDAQVFLQSAVGILFCCSLLILMCRPAQLQLNHKAGILVTALAWAGLSVLGALPLYLAAGNISFVDAVFEATSGFTTTGATVMSNLQDYTHGVLFWRALLQWLGGMGIVVFAIAILPFIGVGGMSLYQREMPGVTKDKLQPRLYETARWLWGMYALLTALCAQAYLLAGMNWFDALCHAMTTVATAGFANYDLSFLTFDSVTIEAIAMLFMLLGAINFAIHLRFIQQRRVSHYLRDDELRVFLTLLAVAIGLVFVLLTPTYGWSWETLRLAAFNTVSIVTTTGFSTADFALWPAAVLLVFLLLMFVGGCSGSTTGGMKVLRVLLITKQSGRELERLLHPRGVMRIKLNGIPISVNTIHTVWAFMGLFVLSFLCIALLLALEGMDLVSAFAAAAACITNVGPGFGSVGPFAGYGHLSDTMKLTLIAAMLLGRLELFTIIVLFLPGFWRK